MDFEEDEMDAGSASVCGVRQKCVDPVELGWCLSNTVEFLTTARAEIFFRRPYELCVCWFVNYMYISHLHSAHLSEAFVTDVPTNI